MSWAAAEGCAGMDGGRTYWRGVRVLLDEGQGTQVLFSMMVFYRECICCICAVETLIT